MDDRAVVRVCIAATGEVHDVDVPLDISAGELLLGLNEAYNLGLGIEDPMRCFVKAENPVVLMHGRKSLGQYGIMDGSIINITE